MSRNDAHRLRGEGLSVRQIAARLGLSRMKVHRWLTAGPEWEGDDEGGWALLEEERLTPPFKFVGLEVEPRPGKPVRGGERYLDANGRSCTGVDVYRWAHHSGGQDRYRQYREYVADMDRQIVEAGLVHVSPGDGYWYWCHRDQVTADMELIGDGDS